MIAVIIDNHIHRLLNNGLIESRKLEVLDSAYAFGAVSINDVVLPDDKKEVKNNKWQVLSPEKDLGITGSDMFMVKKQLELLHALFPEGRSGLPVTEKQKEEYNPNAPRQ